MIMKLIYIAISLAYLISHGEFSFSEEDVLQSEPSIINPDLGNMLTQSTETMIEGGDNDYYQIPDNVTMLTPAPTSSNETKRVIACKLRNSTLEEKHEVEMVNGSRLLEILAPDPQVTNKESEAQCTIVMFYSRLCPFSAMAAPHFNALARSFPDIKVTALDALTYHSFNTQYGIGGVPTLIIFHNGRPVAKFNGTEYTIHSFVKFITIYTGIKEDVIAVHSQDFQGPLPSVMDKEIDYFLVLSWMFIIVCTLFFFSKSFLWKIFIEKVKNIWREAEAQHAHVE